MDQKTGNRRARSARVAEHNRLNFTKAALNHLPLPIPGQRAVYFDKKTTGLQVRLSASGIKTFSLYRWVKGARKPERVTLGRFPDMSIEQARSKAAELNAVVAGGENPNDKTRTLRDEITLGALFEDFLQNRRTRRGVFLSEKTKTDYRKWFDLYVKKWDKKKPSQLADRQIADLHTKVGRVHPTTANRVLAVLQGVFSHAIARKLYKGVNPTKGITKFPETARDRFLQSDELPYFFKALANEPNETVRDYFLISLLAGSRRSNALAMRWTDVNLERAEWTIGCTKNGTPYTVTLPAEAVEILRVRKPAAPLEFVFPGPGKTGHLVEPKAAWKRVLLRAEVYRLMAAVSEVGNTEAPAFEGTTGLMETVQLQLEHYREQARRMGLDPSAAAIKNLRIHDLRRTLGSWQAKTGASLSIIGRSLNHKSTSTTAIYARLDLDPVRESVQRATSAMFAAAGLKPAGEILNLNVINKSK